MGGVTIYAIAYDFKSVSAFNCAFKKATNRTPSQFRDGLSSVMTL
jgi:AraC-like DNA-binding protein